MAVGMKNDHSYDHPFYTVTRQQIIESQGCVSAVDFCVFRCRTKAVVRFMHVKLLSAPSVASGILEITHNGSNQTAYTVSAASLIAGYSWVFTVATSNTLVTITDSFAIQLSGSDLGKWSVLYEYDCLPEWTEE